MIPAPLERSKVRKLQLPGSVAVGGLLALVLMAGGCASSGTLLPQGKQERAEIDELKQRVLELQRQVTVHEHELARLQELVARQERQARTPPPPPPPPPAEAEPVPTGSYRPPAIEEDDLDAVGFRPEADETPTETPPAPPPPATPVPEPVAASAPPEEADPGSGSTPAAPVSAAAQALYDDGYTLYHEGRFLDSEAAFRRFLQAHGTTSLADNAQYWIGEARFARKDYPGALAAFRETVENYPEGNKVPDALLKAGQCFERMGDLEAARDTYREVIRRFPESVAAVTAEERRDLLP